MLRLFFYVRRYWLHLALAVAASVTASISSVLVIDVLREVIDGIAGAAGIAGTAGVTEAAGIAETADVAEVALKMLIALFVGVLSNYLVVYMTGYAGAGLLRDLRHDAVSSLLKASPEYISGCDYGDLMERLSEDIETLAGFISGYFKDCLYIPVITAVYSAYLFATDAGLALLCLLPLVFLVPMNVRLLKPIKLRQFKYVKELGMTNNYVEEAFAGAAVIKAYGLQKIMEGRYYRALKKTFDISNDTDLRQYHLEPISRAIQEVPEALAICAGSAFVLSGNLTIRVLIAYMSVIKKLIDPLSSSYQLIVRSQTALVSVSRVFDVIDIAPEGEGIKRNLPDGDGADVFRLENVSFRYDREQVLDNLCFSVKKGEKAVFVGESGSGKSTIIKLLSRQISAHNGKIYFFGMEYEKLFPGQIRDEIALIAQETYLFPLSVADNVRVGNPDASEEMIHRALYMAGCLDFVHELPEGIDTVLTERGGNLSGGQRQRIAIARAIVKGSKILLLDEPTSALDRENERRICDTIDEISKDMTIITVAHRLSTIREYDCIYVIDGGRIAEQGRHDDLMRRKGIYYRLYTESDESGKGVLQG